MSDAPVSSELNRQEPPHTEVPPHAVPLLNAIDVEAGYFPGVNILNGMTQLDAYKDAYDTRTENDSTISVNANRLLKNPKIAALLGSLTDTFKEKIVRDAVDTRRYVMEQLYSYAAAETKPDGTRLKALEMMGRAVGMFTDKVEQKVEQISTDQLKAELKSHLTLLDNVTPITMSRKKK